MDDWRLLCMLEIVIDCWRLLWVAGKWLDGQRQQEMALDSYGWLDIAMDGLRLLQIAEYS